MTLIFDKIQKYLLNTLASNIEILDIEFKVEVNLYEKK